MQIITIVLSTCFLVNGLDTGIHAKLRYFETLNTVSMTSRRKRRADGNYQNWKEVSFQAFGRSFRLVLYPGTPVLAPDFKVRTVDGHGTETPYHVQPNDFFLGHLADDVSVEVEAHFEDGILSASIQFHNETYAVEPAWRHLPASSNCTMIVYRGSDMTDGGKKMFCGGIKLTSQEHLAPKAPGDQNERLSGQHKKNRRKRTSDWKKSCSLLLVADFLFYSTIGKTVSGTANFLIGVVTRVDRRFRMVKWNSDLTGFGFQVKELLIHTEYSHAEGHYNAKKSSWTYVEKLTKFNQLDSLRAVCLGHLYTSYPFEGNILGLALIASPSHWLAGGICSTPNYMAASVGNTGWTSAMDVYREKVLTLRFELVNMHEFGHNWGSEHDPETGECAPGSDENGKYLMWPIAVEGYEENNHLFSKCSKNWILPVLESKSQACFTNKVKAFCGNGLLEEGEECDHYNFEEDECCTRECTLKPGAKCSDHNFACCKKCQAAPNGTLCADANSNVCRGASYCNGQDYNICPSPHPLPDDTACLQRGKCYKGKCRTFCETQGKIANRTLRPCMCEKNAISACKFCCMEIPPGGGNASCEPTNQSLSEGHYCVSGYCRGGVCYTPETNNVRRFFKFIKTLNVNAIAAMMEANIVGTVLLLSAVLWVVGSAIISRSDKKHINEIRQRHQELRQVFSLLQAPDAQPTVHPSKTRRKSSFKDHRVQFLGPELIETYTRRISSLMFRDSVDVISDQESSRSSCVDQIFSDSEEESS
ncbi:hypothetical protein BaRGS_00029192 [Batillaria attramentaria]|uniref:ADAM 17-like protease n=1 Tax=Batillaria attramentaria TaxID=370345 RepID=A0ABD0JWS2_9CAEN